MSHIEEHGIVCFTFNFHSFSIDMQPRHVRLDINLNLIDTSDFDDTITFLMMNAGRFDLSLTTVSERLGKKIQRNFVHDRKGNAGKHKKHRRRKSMDRDKP